MRRLAGWWDALAAVARRAGEAVLLVARDPLRILPVLTVIALLTLSVPLTITGLSRVGRATIDWRATSAIHWRHAQGEITRVRIDDGLVVDLSYRDRAHRTQRAEVFVGDAGGHWVNRRVPIRYDAGRPGRVEIVGIRGADPVLGLLRAGAPLGAGIAGLVLAVAVWRRRRLIAVSARPIRLMRRPLVVAGTVVAVGIAGWALGTVWERGWSAVASSIGHLVSTVFGDLLGVLVPIVAFALGCVVTAWLARHRHSDEHQGLLGNAHRFIDRAAGLVPSPDELRARPQEPPGGRDETSAPVS
jgi:hypothetical protein